jgi:transmembrane sensor
VVIGFVLYPGTGVVATGIGEQRQLVLEDGTRIFLNTATRLAVEYDEHARRVELREGEALFNVARWPDWPFVVSAGSQQVTALGTSFVVRRDSAKLVVTLVTGKVSVDPVAVPTPAAAEDMGTAAADSNRSSAEATPIATRTVLLTPGQRLTIASGEMPHVDTSSIEESTAWRRGQVVLTDRPLADAAEEMNRYSTVRLVVEDPSARRLEVNGLFQAGDSASFANAVAHAHGLRVVTRDGEIILSGRPNN